MSSLSLRAFEEGYYQFQVCRQNLYFQIHPIGATRVAAIPSDCTESLVLKEGFWHVIDLLGKYKQAIQIIGSHFGWQSTGDPLTVCTQFSEWIIGKELNQCIQLSLKGLQLSILPPQVGLFRNLKELDLSENRLIFLFPELSHLKSLEVLDVSNNLGVCLPDLSQLPSLRVLKANKCDWYEIPEWIERCPLLEIIELEDNKIRTYPEKSAKTYKLKGNPLEDS